MSIFHWTGTSKKADIVECHFCLQKCRLQSFKGKTVTVQDDHIPVIAGTHVHFECPACDSWNIRDRQTGELLDAPGYTANSALESLNGRPTRALRHLDYRPSPFCTHCLTNQSLQVQLLAGYLPLTSSKEEEDLLLSRLPSYRDSLDSRYPVVCLNCQGQVDDIIKERNWKAKARTVGGWLRTTAKLKEGTLTPESADAASVQQCQHPLWLWTCKGACWKTLYAYTAVAPFLPLSGASPLQHSAVASPLLQKFTSARHYHTVAITMAASTIFYSFWDPTYRARFSRAQKNSVAGRKRWMIIQSLLFLARLAQLVLPPIPRVGRSMAYVFAFAHLAVLLFHNHIIWVEGPMRVKLVEHPKPLQTQSVMSPSSPPARTRNPAPAKQTKTAENVGASTAPSFGQVSMGSTPPVSRMYRRHGFGLDLDVDDDMDEDQNDPAEAQQDTDVGMDWQPFDSIEPKADGAMQPLNLPSGTIPPQNKIELRPAVFNPEDDWNLAAYGMKGLDGLFAKGVSLQDTRFDEQSSSARGKSKSRVFLYVLCSGSALLFSLGTCLYFWPPLAALCLKQWRQRPWATDSEWEAL